MIGNKKLFDHKKLNIEKPQYFGVEPVQLFFKLFTPACVINNSQARLWLWGNAHLS